MNVLRLDVITHDPPVPLQFEVKRMVNGGYVGRNTEAVKAHIEELRKEGVPPPPSVPIIFPVLRHNVTTQNEIEVIGSKTSGEVEFVLLFKGDEILVGVGSDHTDRDMERQDIIMSKQVCRNVLSRQVWKYSDVESGWDDLLLRSWVKADEEDKEVLYQNAPLGTIIPPTTLMALVKSKMNGDEEDGLVIFSGTIPILTEKMIYGSYFRGELIDLRSDRALSCEYRVRPLDYLKD